jgi:hypothetical protein
VQLSELEYTPKDEIHQKRLGKVGGSFLQKLNYDYLANGFLSGINAEGGSLNQVRLEVGV